MIDTVRLKSPEISYKLAKYIESQSFLRQGIDMVSGEIIYTITTKQLLGTYDSNISVIIEQGCWEYNKYKGVAEKSGSEYYIVIEASVNKLIYGHNVYGGSNDKNQLYLLLRLVEIALDCEFPDFCDWQVVRLDYAENFEIGEQNVYNYIINLNNSYWGRRKIKKFDKTGIYVPGTTTTLKLYSKGQEFNKHDKKRLKSHLDNVELTKISNIANNILRVELEIKKKKIIYDLGRLHTIRELDIEYYMSLYETEVNKLIKLTGDNAYYYKYDDVKNILFKNYSGSMANSLLGTWLKFSLEGEEKTKGIMSKATFYKHRKMLIECNCSWNNTIVEKREDNIIDFVPYLNSRYRQCNDDYKIDELLKKYEIAI
ncbi:MAG: phage/plasmid replication protein, II/X family [Clostridiaceae bacterium]